MLFDFKNIYAMLDLQTAEKLCVSFENHFFTREKLEIRRK